MKQLLFAAAAAVTFSAIASPATAQQATMSFFISSVGTGRGADLGGLEGADRHCQALAPPSVQVAALGALIFRPRGRVR